MPGSDDPGVEQGGRRSSDPACAERGHLWRNNPREHQLAHAPRGARTRGGLRHRSVRRRRDRLAIEVPAGRQIHGPRVRGAGASEATTAGGPPECLSFADIYALVGPESEDVQTWDQAATLATELGSNTQFPAGLPIAITAPGEESGTFDSFVDVVLGDYLEEREQGDATTRLSNYQSSSDDNAIIDGVANSAGSFGWVGFAFYEENLDRVRAFTVSAEPNGTCVEPTAETIASNEYPISRDLFIYVSKQKLAENPTIAAYVDYYLADGTIDGVLETVPYVP